MPWVLLVPSLPVAEFTLVGGEVDGVGKAGECCEGELCFAGFVW